MNIYKLKLQDINKLDDEFSKTGFGKRARISSMLPFWCAIFSFILFVIEDIVNDGNYFFLCFVALNLAISGVAQLQYCNMLKEFVESKKDKE